MFTIGDYIVYPMHGAGTIESIEERNVMGTKKKYFVLIIPHGDMKIMIPCDDTVSMGVRRVIKVAEVEGVRDTLCGKSSEMAKIWNRRYRDNMEKLKTGKITHVAEVVRDLMRVDSEKKLSTGEKKMLSNAKQILISELSLVSGQAEDELMVLIEKQVMS